MARAATTADAFNAVAEAKRREILDLLAGGERSVNDLVESLDLAQPMVSKHLRVLREVGLVTVRDVGRRRLYQLNGQSLKPIYDWVRSYEQLWTQRLDRLDAVLNELKANELKDSQLKDREHGDGGKDEKRHGSRDAADGNSDPDHPGVRSAQAPGVRGLDHA